MNSYSKGAYELPLHQAYTSIKKAKKELQNGEYKIAIKTLSSALELTPQSTDLKIVLAESYMLLNAYSEVIVILENLDQKEESPESYSLLIKAYLLEGSISEAQALYEHYKISFPEVIDTEIQVLMEPEIDTSPETIIESIPLSGLLVHQYACTVDTAILNLSIKHEIEQKLILPTKLNLVHTPSKEYLIVGPAGSGKHNLIEAISGSVNIPLLTIDFKFLSKLTSKDCDGFVEQYLQLIKTTNNLIIAFHHFDLLDRKNNVWVNLVKTAKSDNKLVLYTTNEPWQLTKRFLNSIHSENIVMLPYPDLATITLFLTKELKNKPTLNINYSQFATQLKNFSFYDLQLLIDLVERNKIEEAFSTQKFLPIEEKDLMNTLKSNSFQLSSWNNIDNKKRRALKKLDLFDRFSRLYS